MSGVLPPVKISELPPYTGADNPDGTLPITIAGTTYGINTSKLGGSGGATPNLSQVIQVGDLDVRDISEDSDLIASDTYQQLNINSGGLVFSIPTVSQTSGLLIIGHRYKVVTYVAGDDISNIGGTNASDVTFTATGTTATNYTNGSTIVDLTASDIIPSNTTVRINNTIVQNPDTGLTISFGVGCTVGANGSILSGSTLVIPNGVKCFLNHLQDLSFTVTYEVGSVLNGNYSTDEILTGATWIDGKPIFRKVFYFNNGDGDIDISTLNVNEVMRDDVFRYNVDTIQNISNLNQSNVSVNGSSESILTCFICSSTVVLADTIISLNYASTVQNLTLLDTPIITSLTANFYRIFEYTKTT